MKFLFYFCWIVNLFCLVMAILSLVCAKDYQRSTWWAVYAIIFRQYYKEVREILWK